MEEIFEALMKESKYRHLTYLEERNQLYFLTKKALKARSEKIIIKQTNLEADLTQLLLISQPALRTITQDLGVNRKNINELALFIKALEQK